MYLSKKKKLCSFTCLNDDKKKSKFSILNRYRYLYFPKSYPAFIECKKFPAVQIQYTEFIKTNLDNNSRFVRTKARHPLLCTYLLGTPFSVLYSSYTNTVGNSVLFMFKNFLKFISYTFSLICCN